MIEKDIIDWDDMNNTDQETITEAEEIFAIDIFNLIQELVVEDDVLTEEFINKNCLNKHYEKHCIANDKSKKSIRSNVYYDFNNRDKYRVYGEDTVNDSANTKNVISSLLDTEKVLKCFRKLFEGNSSIRFALSSGFYNNSGDVKIVLHSFANKVTQNYRFYNTIDLAVLTPADKIITIYPVDANYLENKLNNIIKNYNRIKTQIKINH